MKENPFGEGALCLAPRNNETLRNSRIDRAQNTARGNFRRRYL